MSRKWTFQLSSFQTLPIAAAIPPSAMTVWALPRSDLQMSAVFAPSALRLDRGAQSGAARADHDDVVFVTLRLRPLEHDPRIDDDAHRDQADIRVGERDAEEARTTPSASGARSASSRSPTAGTAVTCRGTVEVSADEIAQRNDSRTCSPTEECTFATMITVPRPIPK